MKENQKLPVKGRFEVQHFDKDGNLKGTYEMPNGIVNLGLNKILDDMFNSGTQSATWSIGLISNTTPTLAAGDTMASHTWTEDQSYSQATRPTWTVGAASSRSVTNAATVDFSMNATVTIFGIFIVDNNVKGGPTGTLWSTAPFASPVSATSGDTLKVTYTVSG